MAYNRESSIQNITKIDYRPVDHEQNDPSRNRRLIAILGLAAASFGLTACSNDTETTSSLQGDNLEVNTSNTDPREGWVVMQNRNNRINLESEYMSILKKCDEDNLVYVSWYPGSSSISVSPNDPQCSSSPTDKP